MKKLLLGLLLISGFIAKAQVYNNEWIDYSKTYYKFKVGKTGLYRISQPVLSSTGLGSTPAEYFQLWRNGKQIPLYTSIATGSLSASDYIEFWGEMNDGKPDRELYRDPNWQLNDKWSLETDTASYFLTVNTSVASNLRLQTTANNVAGTSLPVDLYFMHTAGMYFRDRINAGYAVNVGDNLYSSSYDKGEGWSSNPITTTFNSSCIPTYAQSTTVLSNLNVYKSGSVPAPKFKIAVSGNQINQRNYLAKINSDSISSSAVDFFNYTVDSANFSINTLNGALDTVSIFNYSATLAAGCTPSDQMVVHKYEITYPRNFNFNGQASFEFTLGANAAGNYLQITNFNNGSSIPVLYDLTNGRRYVADVSSTPTLKFVLQPSLTSRNLVLVNEDAGNINSITSFQSRTFIDYSNSSNQGDYLILTSSLLLTGTGTDPVVDYKLYRSSAAGGAYNAKIYLTDQITDQFGFGIKKNPAAIRDFLRYARNKFDILPKHVFIIGRGMTYPNQRTFESYPSIDQLNLVPTFGNPASDDLLVAEPGSSQPEMSIGRLSVIYPSEVAIYLKKVKEFEQAQASQSPLISDKAWMKNVVHIIGSSDAALDAVLSQDMDVYKNIIKGPLYGADVFTFNKTSTDAVSQLSDKTVEYLINNGLSLMTYFGHSSSTTLEFNIDNPENYSNYGKYPLFLGLGCNVGSFFGYSTNRLQTNKETLSEKYVLAPDRGMIGVIGSTHFGIVHYLNIWAERAYRQMTYKNYNKTVGEIIKETAADVFQYTTQEDFYARCNAEETLFHGDPAIHLNPHTKPDYAIEDSMVKVSPTFVSVGDKEFNVDAQFLNLGKAPDSTMILEVKRFRPNETVPSFIHRDTIPGIRYSASMSVKVPIDPTKDKGLNKIVVTVDPDNSIDELFENNNSVIKDVMIYEDEATPVYPYNYAIVNTQNIKLIASTANPFALRKQYQMELDTTELFNSPMKMTRTVDSSGGVLEFDPGINLTNNTVYYWRVAPVVTSGPQTWNTSSFIYLPNSEVGFNQSHFYQQLKATGQNMSLDSASRKWKYGSKLNNLFIRQGSWVSSGAVQEAALSVAVNSVARIRLTCYFQSLVFNVFDPVTFEPWQNNVLIPENSPGYPLGLGLYGSHANQCYGGEPRYHNFEYRYTDSATRKKAMDFMQNDIPDGSYVVVRNFTLDPATFPGFPQAFVDDWKTDENVYGPGKSLYAYLKNAGLAGMDSFYRARPFALVYKKNDPFFTPKWIMGDGVYDNPTLSVDCPTPDTSGNIVSPVFGPAKAWKELRWNGTTVDSQPGDNPRVDVIGIKNDGIVDTLVRNINSSQQIVDVSSVNAATYPFVQLVMHNGDSVNVTPYQLNYWRLTYLPAPEGGVNPSQSFSISDTLEVGQPLQFKMAFKNLTNTAFSDSMKVKIIVTDRNNVQRVIAPPNKLRVLKATPDTLQVSYQLDTRQLTGANTLYVEVNPDNDQIEQYHFNNVFYRNFYIKGDTLNPLLDVTFDDVHILNHDIVSAKPNILIRLKDEAKWNLLDDPSKIKVQVHKFPKSPTDPGYLRDYKVDGDTLQFQPANQALPTNNNTANAIFKPQLEDGEYELIVSGRDMSDNNAGPMEYRVAFEVINKPMISNMMNYPNPFTTSTAFVFTLTGSEVPQNMRIQILTVTGKVVREILKDELGPLHIGRNITEFKWDGTDQYGQKLANGVYLYRVITNLNGKSLDKYTSGDDNTDKYFNKGYGKMYLMR